MSSFIMAAIMSMPILFFYSSRIETTRVVTVTKPLVITQARRTPAYYLYQHAHNLETIQEPTIASTATTFLSTESTTLKQPTVVIAEMILDRQEVGASNDYGFRVAQVRIPNQDEYEIFNGTAVEMAPAIQPNITQPKSSPLLQKWATVRGKFELKDGVGVVDHIVELKRVEEGQVRELGQVDLKQGAYTIDIENPQGYLIAQIRDKNGTLVGEDQQRITKLASQGPYFEGPFIRVGKPAQVGSGLGSGSGFTGGSSTLASAGTGGGLASRGSGKNPTLAQNGRGAPPRDQVGEQGSQIVASMFSNEHQLGKPTDQFGNVSRNSSTIAHIEDRKNIYYNMISIRQTADDNETPLFKKVWVHGAIEYISDQMKLNFKSKSAPLIIGRILIDNKPAAGVQVQIESHMGLTPIYLDEFMIPNMKQEETSTNGYFMFVGLEKESYVVTAVKKNKIIGSQNFIAEENAIAFQNIATTSYSRSVLVRSFDAFTGQPADADVVVPTLDEILEIKKGVGSYRTQEAIGLTNFIVRPKENYMAINYIQDSRKDHVHIPAIHEKWLSNIQTVLEINDHAQTGTIIGFVPEIDYEMYLISDEYSRNNVVYFDQYGDISKAPVKGGGFILFNVPVGAQEVVVQEKKTERIFSQVHVVRSSQTSVSHVTE